MAPSPKPTKRRTYDAAFRAEALRLASESRSTQAAARALNFNPKLLYKWQQVAQTPMPPLLAPAWTQLPPLNCTSCGRPIGDRRRS